MLKLVDFDVKQEEKSNRLESKELFIKCKQIIKQQKQQIQKLIDQNQRLTNVNQQQSQFILQKQQLSKHQALQFSQIQHKNQLLHKELTKTKQSLDNLTQKLATLQSNGKLQNNKIEYLQNQLQQTIFKKQQIQTKQELIQQTLTLLDNQNQKLRSLLRQKETQVINQITQVKKLNSLLKRKHQMDSLQGQFSYIKKYSEPYVKPFETFSEQFLNKSTKSPCQNPQIIKKNLSTDYKRSRSNPKNVNTRSYEVQNQETQNKKCSPILQLSRNTFSFTPSQKKKKLNTQYPHPQLHNQLQSIKSSILDQYKKMENKKQDQNRFLIRNTISQIEDKLGRMIRVSEQDDQSEDQM